MSDNTEITQAIVDPKRTPVYLASEWSEHLRDQLREQVSAELGREIRHELKTIAEETYKQKNSNGDYLVFMSKNECTFSIVGCQNVNHPYYWCLFSVHSQHVYGDCIYSCLDLAMAIHSRKENDHE